MKRNTIMTTKFTAAEQAFAKKWQAGEAHALKESGTQLSREATLAAEQSLKSGWTDESFKWSADESKRGEATTFFGHVLLISGRRVSKTAIDTFALGAHPNSRDRVGEVIAMSLKIHEREGGRVNNTQQAMLRAAKRGETKSQIMAAGNEMAKKGAAALAEANTKTSDNSSTKIIKTNAALAKELNEVIAKTIAKYVTTEHVTIATGAVKLTGKSFPNGLSFKQAAKPKAKKAA